MTQDGSTDLSESDGFELTITEARELLSCLQPLKAHASEGVQSFINMLNDSVESVSRDNESCELLLLIYDPSVKGDEA